MHLQCTDPRPEVNGVGEVASSPATSSTRSELSEELCEEQPGRLSSPDIKGKRGNSTGKHW